MFSSPEDPSLAHEETTFAEDTGGVNTGGGGDDSNGLRRTSSSSSLTLPKFDSIDIQANIRKILKRNANIEKLMHQKIQAVPEASLVLQTPRVISLDKGGQLVVEELRKVLARRARREAADAAMRRVEEERIMDIGNDLRPVERRKLRDQLKGYVAESTLRLEKCRIGKILKDGLLGSDSMRLTDSQTSPTQKRRNTLGQYMEGGSMKTSPSKAKSMSSFRNRSSKKEIAGASGTTLPPLRNTTLANTSQVSSFFITESSVPLSKKPSELNMFPAIAGAKLVPMVEDSSSLDNAFLEAGNSLHASTVFEDEEAPQRLPAIPILSSVAALDIMVGTLSKKKNNNLPTITLPKKFLVLLQDDYDEVINAALTTKRKFQRTGPTIALEDFKEYREFASNLRNAECDFLKKLSSEIEYYERERVASYTTRHHNVKLPLEDRLKTLKTVDFMCSVATQCSGHPTNNKSVETNTNSNNGEKDGEEVSTPQVAMLDSAEQLSDRATSPKSPSKKKISTRRLAQHAFIVEFQELVDNTPGFGTFGVRTILANLVKSFGPRGGTHSFEAYNYHHVLTNVSHEHLFMDSTVSVLNYLRCVMLVEESAFVDLIRDKMKQMKTNFATDLQKSLAKIDGHPHAIKKVVAGVEVTNTVNTTKEGAK